MADELGALPDSLIELICDYGQLIAGHKAPADARTRLMLAILEYGDSRAQPSAEALTAQPAAVAEALRNEARELLSEALSAAESAGHPLNHGRYPDAGRARDELLSTIDALAALAQPSVEAPAAVEVSRLRDALHLIIGVTEGKDCPGLDKPTDFAFAQSRGIRLATVRRMAVAARASQASTASEPPKPSRHCSVCGDTGVVPDGVLTGQGGVEYSEPIQCVKDCPACALAASEPAARLVSGVAAVYRIGLSMDDDDLRVLVMSLAPGAATVVLSKTVSRQKLFGGVSLKFDLAATPSPAANEVAGATGEQPGPSGDQPSDFQEGQWWLKKLDDVAAAGTDDFKRAVAVVRNMMNTMHAQGSLASPASGAVEPQAWTDVRAERQRQISAEGWTPSHDDNDHDAGELAGAASAYALAAADKMHPFSQGDGGYADEPPTIWPWDASAWKHAEPRRMLVKAGALILAEIERLDRLNLKT